MTPVFPAPSIAYSVTFLRRAEYFYMGRVESAIDEFYLHYAAMAHQVGAKYILVAPWDLEKSVPENGGRFFAAIRGDPGLEKVFSSNGVELFRVR